jgi:hypothetical protein
MALPRTFLVAFGLSALLPSAARGQELMELLSRGPVVLMETDGKGKFAQATAVISIDEPWEKVWALAIDLGRFKDFMPKVVKSDVTTVSVDLSKPGALPQYDLNLEVEVPGANPDYTFRYTLDAAKREMSGQWVKGDLKGSHCKWRLVALGPTRTLLYYTAASKNFSSMATALEDDQQTITVGVNITAALATAKAVKRRAESPPVAEK